MKNCRVSISCCVLYLTMMTIVVRAEEASNETGLMESLEGVETFSERLGKRPVDLVFVLDRSASIPVSGWQTIVSFMYSVLEHFTVDSENTRVAVVTYSTSANVDVNDLLDLRENKCSLIQRLRQRVEPKVTAGYTATYRALRKTYDLLLNSRKGAKKAVIVLTDGRSNVGTPPAYASLDIRSLRWSPQWDVATNGPQTEIFAFGVHDAQWSELKSIASPLANHTFYLREFTEYRDLAQLLHRGRQRETWEVTGRAGSCSSECSTHATCVCSTGSGEYTCLCKPGYHGNGLTCTPCPVGQFKSSLRPGACDLCPGNMTTPSPGATSPDQCGCTPPYVPDPETDSVCGRRACEELPPVAHGHSFHVWGMSRSEIPDTGVICANTAGDSCHFICDTGYRIHGLPALVCDINGTWIGQVPECKVVDCHRLQDHGEIEPRASVTYLNETTTFGSVLGVSCDRGWRLFGSMHRVCGQNGIWSGVPAKCVEAMCPVLPSVIGGTITPETCAQGRQPPGAVCSVTCTDGYDVIGPETKTCDYHGDWDNYTLTYCKDVQPPEISCPDDILVPATSGNYAIVYWDHEQPHVTDNSGETLLSKVVPFSENPANVQIGYHQMKYVAADLSGNSAFCTRSVQVIARSVRIDHCPENVTLTNIQGLGETVQWSPPRFFDHSDRQMAFRCTKESGSYFSLGSHNVICYPEDRYDHSCRFTVHLKRTECERPEPPQNGAYSCATTQTFLWLCSVHCHENYAFHRPPLDFYHCNLNGEWNDNRMWPDCSRRRYASVASVKGRMQYWYFTDKCDSAKETIEQLFREKLDQYTARYCFSSDCRIAEIDVRCGAGEGRRRKRDVTATSSPTTATPTVAGATTVDGSSSPDQTAVSLSTTSSGKEGANYNPSEVTLLPSTTVTPVGIIPLDSEDARDSMEIVFRIAGSLPEETNVTEESQWSLLYSLQEAAYMILTDLHYNSSSLDLTLNNETLHVSANTSVVGEPVFSQRCEPGQVALTTTHSAMCVNCPAGTYSVGNETGDCEPCPVGTFQDGEQQTSCQACPDGLTTAGNGTTSRQQCTAPCRKGSVSPIGLEPCDLCDIGLYQSEAGQTSCDPCPYGQSTAGPGSDGVASCRALCSPGSFNEASGLEPCELCPFNMYQPGNGSRSCLPCPENTGINQKGATSSTVCNRIDYCSNVVANPCRNGGTCRSRGTAFTCHCLPGFTGQTCDIDIDECASAPCLNNATCRQNSSAGFTCHCPVGFSGELCEAEVDECMSNPCENGGSCDDVLGGVTCYCDLGWEGDLCERAVNRCQSEPCHHGVCENQLGGFFCHCSPGYVGRLCDAAWSACNSEPCLNGGVCGDLDHGGFTCRCPPGYIGVKCEIEIDECQSDPCLNEATCIDKANGYTCQCAWGYVGNRCQTAVSPDFDLVLTGTGSYVHLYDELSVPDLTQFSVSFWLRSSDAMNFGTVLSYRSGDEFGLPSGFSIFDYGRLKVSVNGEVVDTGLRLNTGMWTCVVVTWGGGSWAIYLNGSAVVTGIDLAYGQIIGGQGHVVIGENQKSPGELFGRRESFVGEISQLNIYSYALRDDVIQAVTNQSGCNSEEHGNVLGWTHALIGVSDHVTVRTSSACLDVNECLFPEAFPCGPRRVCRDLIGGYSCKECIYGYIGPNCDQPMNECLLLPCLHGGSCSDGPDIYDYVCTCAEGYTGSLCEDFVDLCASAPCQNGGVCQQDSGTYQCNCTRDGQGSNCEDTASGCRHNPCRNGGRCLSIGNNQTRCECQGGFGGKFCGTVVSPCDSSPCNNGGNCWATGDGYVCNCTKHYTGKYCDVLFSPSCDLSPCLNGATCVTDFSRVRGFRCVCPENGPLIWDELCGVVTGCESNPCGEWGSCVHHANRTVTCLCRPGTSGPLCTNGSTADLCRNVQCLNGGRCAVTGTRSMCLCADHYKGPHCEVEAAKESRLYEVRYLVLTPSPKAFLTNQRAFKDDISNELLWRFRARKFSGVLKIQVVDLQEDAGGLDVTFQVSYEYHVGSELMSHVLSPDGIRRTLKSVVTARRLGPYNISPDLFNFRQITHEDSADRLRIYLGVGVAVGGILSTTLVLWIVWRVWRDRRSPPRAHSPPEMPYSPYRRASILNNAHEMVILNPIGNPAYQSDPDLSQGHAHPCSAEENPYAELSDLPLPYAITSKAELKEAFLLRRYSSRRNKDSNIELAAAMKASQESKTKEKAPDVCEEDGYLRPVAWPKNEFSKENKTKGVNELGAGGEYLNPRPVHDTGRQGATLPAHLHLSESQQREAIVEESTQRSPRPPDYLEVCPPRPEDLLPPGDVDSHRPPPFPPRLGVRSGNTRHRELPPVPAIPVDEEV